MEALLSKIESYGFECEAGPLALCVDWQKLKVHVLLATAQPAAEPVRREIPGGRWSCPTCGKSFLRDLMTRHPDDCVSAQPVAETVLQCNCDLRLRGQLTAGWVCPVHGQQW